MAETLVPRSIDEARLAASDAAPVEGLALAGGTAAAAIAGRYEFLDAIRGLAAVLVAVQHGSEMLQLPLGRSGAVLNLGETGVVAFFLVSGFIIPRSLERHGSLKAFWVGRAFRLYPAYWPSLAGALLLIAVGRYGSPFAGIAHPGLGVLANAAMLQRVFGVPQALGVYWTPPPQNTPTATAPGSPPAVTDRTSPPPQAPGHPPPPPPTATAHQCRCYRR